MKLVISLAMASLAQAAGMAHAQDNYPSKPIKLIVPYPPGGSTDQLTRALAEQLTQKLKQSVIVENKAGANGTLGAIQMLGAKPDGYTLTLIPLSVFRQPHLQKVNFNPSKDFTYVSMIANYDYLIAVAGNSKWNTVQDLVRYAKEQPISYGTAGLYSTNHLQMFELGRITGVKWTEVAFKGDPETIGALLGGHIQVASTTNTVLPYVNAGTLKVLATGKGKRAKAFPNTPTLKELGYPVAVSSPVGIAGPAGMPQTIVDKLDAAIAEALKDKKLQKMADDSGIEIDYANSAEYQHYAQRTFAEEKNIIERFGIAAPAAGSASQ